ncbi:MAG TPA: hypothetical protein VFE75_06405 [Rhodanobacter sp.]|nr:hypothetical protein [Rhodanobacter sp.]
MRIIANHARRAYRRYLRAARGCTSTVAITPAAIATRNSTRWANRTRLKTG